jgi:probable HAF family extracellular repeat protein
MIGLGCLYGTGADSWATAINDNGVIVGASYPGLAWGGAANPGPHAFVYSNGTMKDLGIIPGTPGNSGSQATAINNAGTIVGYAEINTTSGTSDPVMWDPDGTIHDLGSLPGGYPDSGGAAYGINNANQVVGSAYNASGDQVGMIYERGQMLDLNTLIDQTTGWNIDSAIAISNTGVILAEADNSNVDPDGFGWGHAVLLSPLPGDANLDGTVDINDLTIVLSNYGKTGATWFDGDFTGSGTVDINDLTIVLANYDQTVGAAGIKAVPEPSCVVLLGISAVGLLGYAWRLRKRNS